jgi:predicted N-acyltransferase
MPTDPPHAPAPPPLQLEVAQGIGAVPAAAWDALVPPDDPFCAHAFLGALERSGSAAPAAGWTPLHLLLRRGGALVGAVPCYAKTHSYGEYIFDWGWAQACQRAGVPYYPKLVAAVPFTPATGRRVLVAPGEDPGPVEAAALAGLRELARATRSWSAHLLFCTGDEHQALPAADPAWIPRTTSQYHWVDEGYGDFEGWLGAFRAKARKEARRERRAPAELGARVRLVAGADLSDAELAAIEGFYRDTCDKKWGEAYLHPGFFEELRTGLAPMVLALIAEVDGAPVASALLFQRGRHLYGRYWGCRPGFEALHFEICYHRPIELCLERGWTRFEAGAQGEHKLKRGLLPAPTFSVHWLKHPGLADAVREAVAAEAAEVLARMEALAPHGPLRRGPDGG